MGTFDVNACEKEFETRMQNFLQSEIQQDLALANFLMEAIDQKQEFFEFTGNSHHLIVNRSDFEIQNLFVECEIVKGKTIALKHSIQSWIHKN